MSCLKGPTDSHEDISEQDKVKTKSEAHGKGYLDRGTEIALIMAHTQQLESYHNQVRKPLTCSSSLRSWNTQCIPLPSPPHCPSGLCPTLFLCVWPPRLHVCSALQHAQRYRRGNWRDVDYLVSMRTYQVFWTIWSWKTKSIQITSKTDMIGVRSQGIHSKLRELSSQTLGSG